MQTQTTRPSTPRAKAMEHRWGERVTLDIQCRLLLRDGTCVDGVVRNASISGALSDTAQPIPLYTSLNVCLAAPQGTDARTLELPACVLRVAPGAVAVEWRDMAVPTLVALLREAGGNPDALCRRDHVFDRGPRVA